MSEFTVTEKNRIHRLPGRGHYDRETIYPILDEALVCHVAFTVDDQPFVIPTIHARMGDTLVFHGAKSSRMLRHIQVGHPICVAVTLVDGLVFARSAFHHSMNYRSVVLFGTGALLESDSEKLQALEAISEHVAPGRWQQIRAPNPRELRATAAIAMPIDAASAKVRTGPPVDDEDDYDLPVWAGVLPLELQALQPEDDPRLATELAVPDDIASYRRGA